MKSVCKQCSLKKTLKQYDYSNGGCVHTKEEGYACLAFIDEGIIVHMVGINPDSAKCEMFRANNTGDAK